MKVGASRLRAGALPRTVLIAALTSILGCTPSLPEPESQGAQLYEQRCATCHRIYPPNVMTKATWEVMLKRMQGEMRRRGIAPLSQDESHVLLDYLSRHALDSGEANDQS